MLEGRQNDLGIRLKEKRDKKTYCVNIQRLCFIMTRAAQEYYDANKEKFDFFHFSVIDKTNDCFDQ